jgi:hypothetical protein
VQEVVLKRLNTSTSTGQIGSVHVLNMYMYIYIYFYPEKALDSPIECSADLPAKRAAALIKYNYRWRIS